MSISRLITVLPAYNEAENLPILIESLEKVFSRMSPLGYAHSYVIVDDGSRDETPQVLARLRQRLPMEVITHELNQGLGITLRDGLRRASQLAGDDDVILTMDADNTHPTGLIQLMVQKIAEGNDIVVASRYRYGARVLGLAWHRRILSLGAAALFKLIFPIPGVRDFTCGFRAYRAAAIRRGFDAYAERFVDQRGFQCTADILIRLARLGVIIVEVPMILRYDLKGGASKMRVASTVLSTLRLLVQRRLETLRPLRDSTGRRGTSPDSVS